MAAPFKSTTTNNEVAAGFGAGVGNFATAELALTEIKQQTPRGVTPVEEQPIEPPAPPPPPTPAKPVAPTYTITDEEKKAVDRIFDPNCPDYVEETGKLNDAQVEYYVDCINLEKLRVLIEKATKHPKMMTGNVNTRRNETRLTTRDLIHSDFVCCVVLRRNRH